MSSRRGSTTKPQPEEAGGIRGRPERGGVSSFLDANLIPVLIFLFALFFIVTFSNPALFLNDEWITVNQLHQLAEGHQVIVNEGKYGTFLNGTPGNYFQARNNLLGYTMMLPVLSLPALWFFGLFGDQFRLAIVLLWSFLPAAMAVLVDAYRPEYARWRGMRWTWLVIGGAFVGFLANLFLYSPWPFTEMYAPGETAAVIFTNHLIFAALAVMIYLICKTIFEDTWFSVFGTVACICCSSYIFWAANAKDHILVAAMVAAVILFMVRYIQYGGLRDAAIGFMLIGLLAWARPEVGLTVFLTTAAYYTFHIINARRSLDYTGLARSFTVPLFTLLGALPLFINNLYVTGNPLVPAFYVYEKKLTQAASTGFGMIGADAIGNITQSVPAPSGGFDGFIMVIINHFAPSWGTLLGDVFGILFAPESGNMSLVAVSPMVVFALILLPLIFWRYPERFNRTDRKLMLFLVSIGVAIWLAYLRSLHGLNTSHGIIPDIRYLVPFYLPAGLLGLFAIRKYLEATNTRMGAVYNIFAAVLVAPLLILSIMVFQPYGGAYLGYTTFFGHLTYFALSVTLVIFITRFLGVTPKKWIYIATALLITVPLGWQVMMLFLYSISKFNGYELWIPLIETFYSNVIGVKY